VNKMNKSVLLVALILAPLSGCLGIPEGAIAHGDTVQVVIDVFDADTGESLVTNTAESFIVGDGDAGYGFEFERQLIAKADDFEGTLIIRNDPSVQWNGQVSVQARYASPLVQTAPYESYNQSFGEPNVGDIFRPPQALFDYQVVSIEGDQVAYKPIPEQGQRDPVPVIAAFLVTFVEDNELVQVLEPDVGATFRVLPPSPFNPTTPLGLGPGSYRALIGDGETITYDQSAVTNPELAGRNLRIQVSVTSLTKADGVAVVEPVDGNYGVRQSPAINGAPSSTVSFGQLSGESFEEPEAADDGHDHQH
jgi:hypothetical protein